MAALNGALLHQAHFGHSRWSFRPIGENMSTDVPENRDMKEFEAQILDAAAAATPEDRLLADRIVSKLDVTSIETLTPIVAALLFVELNKHNRDFSLAKAHAYAHQMGRGYWRLVHQGLAFYQNKRLADGQHRIAAVFLSRTTQQFTVFRNFSEDAMEAIDTAKRRTAGDAFGITGLFSREQSTVAGSIVETIMKYEYRRLHARSITPSIYEQKEWATDHRTSVQNALGIADRVVRGDPILTKPEVGSIALGMLLGGYAIALVESYLSEVMQSIGRYPDSPTIDLHKKFLTSREREQGTKGKLSKEEKLALAFKGAALFALNQATGGLRWKAGKDPLPAPTPPAPMREAAD
jgi:hypothetical protein